MPLAIDLYCGLGGWTEGFLSEGWDVIGFDIERHQYGDKRYPAQLVLQDVLTLHGAQFAGADCIVASPPCQFFSRMAMPFRCPWDEVEFRRRRDLALALFWACFRIQQEATDASRRYMPLVIENVCGAQRWVGDAQWHFGSYYLWGDLPALMPITASAQKFNPHGTGHGQGSWFAIADSKNRGSATKVAGFRFDGSGRSFQTAAVNGTKVAGLNWSNYGKPGYKAEAFNGTAEKRNGLSRKAAPAEIAKIPFPLAQHIARVFKPDNSQQMQEDLPYTESEPLIC